MLELAYHKIDPGGRFKKIQEETLISMSSFQSTDRCQVQLAFSTETAHCELSLMPNHEMKEHFFDLPGSSNRKSGRSGLYKKEVEEESLCKKLSIKFQKYKYKTGN